MTLTSFISPYAKDRDAVRARLEAQHDFIEVFMDVSCPNHQCLHAFAVSMQDRNEALNEDP